MIVINLKCQVSLIKSDIEILLWHCRPAVSVDGSESDFFLFGDTSLGHDDRVGREDNWIRPSSHCRWKWIAYDLNICQYVCGLSRLISFLLCRSVFQNSIEPVIYPMAWFYSETPKASSGSVDFPYKSKQTAQAKTIPLESNSVHHSKCFIQLQLRIVLVTASSQ